MRSRLPLCAVVLSMTLAGCGSTVAYRATVDVPGAGLGSAGEAQNPSSQGADQSGGLGATTGAGSATTSTTGQTLSGGSPSEGAPALRGQTGSTRALKPAEVGFIYFTDLQSFAAATGNTSSVGDTKAQGQAAINWVNAHGGLAGHKLAPVWAAVQLTDSRPYQQKENEVCALFTQDHHVIAASSVGASTSDYLPECLAKHGLLYESGGASSHDDVTWQRFPFMFSPAEANNTYAATAILREAIARGAVKKGDKVGLLTLERPALMRSADNIMKPGLAKIGASVVEYRIPLPASTTDLSSSVASVQSAQLRMATDGVTTVVSLCPACISFFAQDAESQAYYPRYVLSSLDGLTGLSGSNHAQSFDDAIALGWSPLQDVTGNFSNRKLTTTNSTRQLCETIEKPTGQLQGDQSYWASMLMCDSVLQIWQAARRNPANPLNGAALIKGISSFATSWPSAVDWSSTLTAHHHGGASAYKPLHWDGGCSCFLYDKVGVSAF